MTTDKPQSDQVSSEGGPKAPGLSLFVPAQSPPPGDTFLQDTRETQEWFAGLPMANVGETARRIYSTLVDFNRMEFPPTLRARNAELFREPVEYICTNLRRHFVDTGFPLSEKGRKAASLARALYQEMSIAYKAIVLDLLLNKSERLDKKVLVISLHRAMHYLYKVMYFSSLTYGAWPSGLWREIHTLYAFASQNRIHAISVKDSDKSTLETIYLSCLLFATATPHRLRQGQQLALINELPAWTRHVSLQLPDETESGVGRYLVDMFSDRQPAHEDLDAPAANRRLRRLDLRPLLKHLRQRFEETPWHGGASTDTKGHSLNRPLLRSLILSWSTSQERRFVRTRLSFELHVICGLHSLHEHLLEVRSNQPEEVELDSRDRYHSRFIREQDTRPIDPWSEPFSHGLGSASVDAESIPTTLFDEGPFGSVLSEPAPSEPLPSMGGHRAGDSVRTLNESAGGYCVQWAGEKMPKVRIGELLGIQGRSQDSEYSLAVIRWMRQDGNHPLQFGVELIAPQCYPAEVVPHGNSRSQYPTMSQRCLVIPRKGPDQRSDAMILPSALYGVGAELQMSFEGKRQNIRLIGVVETTGAFAHYQFEMLQSGKEKTEPQENDSEFDDLWNNL